MCCLVCTALGWLFCFLFLLAGTLEFEPTFETLDEAHEEEYHKGQGEASNHDAELHDDQDLFGVFIKNVACLSPQSDPITDFQGVARSFRSYS